MLQPSERASRKPTPKLTTGQAAAGARAAGMAQNQASIQELQDRLSDTRNPISRINLENQIKQLGQGGVPVVTQKSGPAGSRYSGETLTVGVVRGGRFSGRQGYDPSTGATKFDAMRGAYTTRSGSGVSVSPTEDTQPTASATAPSPPLVTGTAEKRMSVGMSEDAARRAMMSSGAGAAARRKYFGSQR
tara:strand:+ start:527 stop:1093 length:567 start_codon:yes stop_codon:yes gene_type:complete